MLPADTQSLDAILPVSSTIYVTVHPEAMRSKALAGVQTVIGVGPKANDVVASFCHAVGTPVPALPPTGDQAQVLFWDRHSGEPPRWVAVDRPRQERQRHTRKYAEGELGPDKSFYFRGPACALNLRAHNLRIFLQMADGVDDDTWMHHLRRGDYAHWFRDSIKDDDLAAETERIQQLDDPVTSRRSIREAVERRYTAPAEVP